MRVFECGRCGQWLFFDNVRCERCGADLGYRPWTDELVAVTPAIGTWVEPDGGPPAARCATWVEHGTCNWLVDPDAPGGRDPGARCASCSLTRTVPDLSTPASRVAWERVEDAKRRAVRELVLLGLPVRPLDLDPRSGIAFDLLGQPDPEGPSGVVTGHADGVVTIDIAEAHDPVRERRRVELAELYRTSLGHVRHEVGHRFWENLVRDDPARLAAFRDLFGDERADYGRALERHYAQGADPDWPASHVSAYASAHPWEDWAETWAHYLHIVDALETCDAFGVQVRTPPSAPRVPDAPRFSEVVAGRWLPLAYAVNSVNRSLGEHDLYPFVLSGPVLAKLDHVADLVAAAAEPGPVGPGRAAPHR